MNEPWKDEPEIWKAFCKEKEWLFNSEIKKQLFQDTRNMKDEYEWFRKGYLTNKH
jgi:hypothetical protein